MVIQAAPEAIRLWVILDEPALRRSVGSTEVMREQTRHILELAHRPKITVQLMPNEAPTHPGMDGSFSILGFPATSDLEF